MRRRRGCIRCSRTSRCQPPPISSRACGNRLRPVPASWYRVPREYSGWQRIRQSGILTWRRCTGFGSRLWKRFRLPTWRPNIDSDTSTLPFARKKQYLWRCCDSQTGMVHCNVPGNIRRQITEMTPELSAAVYPNADHPDGILIGLVRWFWFKFHLMAIALDEFLHGLFAVGNPGHRHIPVELSWKSLWAGSININNMGIVERGGQACAFCIALDLLDTERSVFMQRLGMQGVAGEPGQG